MMRPWSWMCVGVLAGALAGCGDRPEPARAAETIAVDPQDLARLRLRHGSGGLAKVLGVPGRLERARPNPFEEAHLRQRLHRAGSFVLPRVSPLLPVRATGGSGGAR